MSDSFFGTEDTATQDELEVRAELIERARKLHPLLRANAGRADRDRRLPDETFEAMREAGLFRLSTPKRYGGYQLSQRSYTDVIAEIAKSGDGAAAWYLFITNATAWVLGTSSEQAQEAVWKHGPDTVVISQFQSTGPAEVEKTSEGWVLSGRWDFASANAHGDFTLLGWPEIGPDGVPVDIWFGVVPMTELERDDSWFTVGLRGTGSGTVIADKVFVPDAFASPLSSLLTHHHQTPFSDEWQYQQPAAGVLCASIAGVITGLAQGALEQTVERLETKPRGLSYTTYADKRESPAIQFQLAEAANAIDLAVLQSRAAVNALDAWGRSGEEAPLLERSRARYRVASSFSLAREAVDRLLNVHGAGFAAESNPIQRIWRDINTGSRHGLVNQELILEVFGRAIVGADDDQRALLL